MRNKIVVIVMLFLFCCSNRNNVVSEKEIKKIFYKTLQYYDENKFKSSEKPPVIINFDDENKLVNWIVEKIKVNKKYFIIGQTGIKVNYNDDLIFDIKIIEDLGQSIGADLIVALDTKKMCVKEFKSEGNTICLQYNEDHHSYIYGFLKLKK
jgi:hypothetical protein